ncbi:MurR/RpiR family transcriptional regulator [Pseudoflavonifractor sp. 60]|uniref:MurR/RpiR family transcriptional regulator n=1 Tax=Pseudoflavonifractor sp. 60 TaxID=2304576 RepID=UPI00136C2109|nr:MurR/RpiR family transcriptional regulator [Pseudoflavonifractor sp. 60]
MDIVADIKRKLPKLTKSQKLIAALTLEDPMAIAFSSIDQAAKTAHVSTATIVRFANTLGLNGYSELQEKLRQYCQSQLNPISRLEKNVYHQKTKKSILDHIYDVQLNNLRLTYSEDLEDKLMTTVQYLKEAPHIYTCGSRGSAAISYYLGHHLNRVFGNVDILPDDSRIVDFLLRIQPGDLLLVSNMPRYSKGIYHTAKIAKAQGAKIVSITDSLASPYDSISDILLPASCHSSDFHNSLLSAMLIAEMLITLLISGDMTEASARLNQMEPLFQEMDIFL